MSGEQGTWTQLHTLAQRARQAGTARRRFEFDLSPDESLVLADVLEAALHISTTVASKLKLDLSDAGDDELAYLAMQGGAFDWLADEPDLYSDDDLQERFEWVTA
jgi:hypothetical protein